MTKLNCWEYEKCGREPGGANEESLGVCPASTLEDADGYLGGKNGGRACAFVTGTFCAGTIQGTFKDKEKNCFECAFYQELQREHKADLAVFNFHDFVKSKKKA
jgi:hypothetical protein